MYAGNVDASLRVANALTEPHLGGWLRFSRGTVFLSPQQSPAPGTPGGPAVQTPAPSSPMPPEVLAAAPERDVVAQAFAMLKAGRKRAILGSLAPAQVGGAIL